MADPQYRNLFDEFAPSPGASTGGYQDPTAQPQDPTGSTSFLGDLAMAPVRGIAGAASGVANLFGAGIQDNWGLGHSETLVGGLIEGVSQFMVGFIPAAGLVGRFGALSNAAQKASTGVKAAAIGLGRGAVAGAVADFTVFDGNDPRLSNLIQSVPALQNPLSEFLAADKNDGQLLGRVKNVIEGAGLGVATEGLLAMFKGIKNYNRAVAKGDTAAAAAASEDLASIAQDTLQAPVDALDAEAKTLLDPASVGARRPEEEGALPLPQEPDPTAPSVPVPPEGEVLSTDEITNRVGWNPEDGTTVVVNANDVSGTLRGFSQIDGFVREPGSRLDILQLDAEAKTLRSGTNAARRLLGNTKGFTPEQIEQQLLTNAKQSGYDAVSFRRKNGVETVVLNEEAIKNRINVKSDQSFWDYRAAALANQDPRLVANSPIASAVHNMDLTPETVSKFLDVLDEAIKDPTQDFMGKAANTVNLAKLGDRGKRAFYEVFATQFDHEKLRDPSVSWDSTVDSATKELSKMIGADPFRVTKALDLQANAVNKSPGLAVASKKYADILLNEMTALTTDLTNGKVIKDAHGNALSREQGIEMLAQNMEYFQAFLRSSIRLGSALGRGLNSMKIGVGRMSQNAVMRALEVRGGNIENILKTAKQVMEYSSQGNTVLGSQLMRDFDRKHGFMGKVMDWYMFSLLSAPKTLTTNIVGSTATMMFKPLETSVGAWVGKKLLGADRAKEFQRTVATSLRQVSIARDMMMEAAGLRGTLSEDTQTAVEATTRAYKSAQGVLVPERAWQEGAATGAADPTSEMGSMVKMMLAGTKLPSKFMAASDEFIKQVSYHSHIRAELIERAQEQGLKGPDLADWVDGQMAQMTLQGQAKNERTLRSLAEEKFPANLHADETNRQLHIQDFIDKNLSNTDAQGNFVAGRSLLMDDALRIAREVTFTSALTPERGILSKTGFLLQQLAEDHPTVRFFTPFIRTPLNILMFTADRLPIPGLNKEFAPMLQFLASKTGLPVGLDRAKNRFVQAISSSDPRVASEALGRATTAMGALAVMGSAAMAGTITGAGPSDPVQHEILRSTGWQPYSIKVGDTYVSYQRFDPFASIMSFYADWSDTVRYGSHDEAGTGDIAMGALTALIENVNSKSYLAGLTDLFKVLSDPEKHIPNAVGRIAGSLAIPNIFAASRSFTDDHFAEMRSVLDRVRARVPFLSDDGNLQRNALGEPVNKKTFGGVLKAAEGIAGYMLPIQINTTGSDVIDNELADLAYPFSGPAPQKYGVDLRDYSNSEGKSAYDRWQQLTSETTIGGRTLRSAMERLINSNRYQALDKQTIDKLDVDSPRIQLITGLLGKYRRQAEREMMAEFPDLQELTKSQRLARRALQSGSQTGDIQSLLQGR